MPESKDTLGVSLTPEGVQGERINLTELRRIAEAAKIRFSFMVEVFTYNAVVSGPRMAPNTKIYARDDLENSIVEVPVNLTQDACRAAIIVRREAYQRGKRDGALEAQKAIRTALGVPGYAEVEPRQVRFGGGV